MSSVFFAAKWLLQGAWFPDELQDFISITVPIENIFSQVQRSGDSPLWAPELAGGYPLLSIGQLSYWYPPHMALRQFLPGVWVLNISLLLHSILAAVGTFYLLRLNKVGVLASALGSLLLPLSGAFVGKFILISIILPFMWVPLLFYLLQQFLERGRLIHLLYWLLSSVLVVLVGHPQIMVQIFLFESLFILCLLYFDWRRLRRAALILLGSILVFGLTSFQLLPILDVVPFTDRAGGVNTDEELFDFNFPIEALKGVVLAHPFGRGESYVGPKNEAELSSYIGFGAVVLACVGFVAGRRKYPAIWIFSVVSVVVGMLLALGGDTPVYRWLVSVGWKYFNVPARFFLFTHFGLVFLAALGFQYLASRVPRKGLALPYKGMLIVLALVPTLWVSWSWYEGVPWEHTDEPALATVLKGKGGFVRTFSKGRIMDTAPNSNFGITVWDPACSECTYRQSFVAQFDTLNGIRLRLAPGTMSGLITVTLYTDSGEQLRAAALRTEEIIDAEWSEFIFDPLQGVLGSGLYFEVTSDIAERKNAPRLYIHTNPDNEQYDPTGEVAICDDVCTEVVADSNTVDLDFQVTTPRSGSTSRQEALSLNVPAGYGLGTAQWAGSLGIVDVVDYIEVFGGQESNISWEEHRSLINRFPVTHFVSLFPPHRYVTDVPNLVEEASVPFEDEFIRVYRNDEAFPRVQFAENVRAMSGPLEQRKVMAELSSTDQGVVVADIPENAEFESGGRAEILTDKRNRVVIQTTQASEGFLVVRDVLLPGWTASVDGVETPIHRTDSLFRGVIVPAGEHEVIFEYNPGWIQPAIRISTAAFIITLILGYFGFKTMIFSNK
ncbi:MAG: hypothetical protein WEC84_01190 [Candidatus Andersenbacteria bacterium]